MWIGEIILDFSLGFIDDKLFLQLFLSQEGDHEG